MRQQLVVERRRRLGGGLDAERARAGPARFSMQTSAVTRRANYDLLGHWQSSSHWPQHSPSQVQSGQSLQQSLLQQRGFSTGAVDVDDDDRPTVPAANAASSTKPKDSFVSIRANSWLEVGQAFSLTGYK